MTADLKAAREHTEDRLTTFAFDADESMGVGIKLGALRTLLTALDQAAEALKPFAEAAGDFRPDDADTMRPAAVQARYFRRAATVYATLKPVDCEEGEVPPHLVRLANAPHIEPDHDWDGEEGREGRRDLTEDEG